MQKTHELAVLEIGGLGFALSITATTAKELPPVGKTGKVYTYLYVREDRLTLFGFSTPLERTVFTLLLDVAGIGPRTAQAILSTFTAPALIQVVNRGDTSALLTVTV